MQERQSSCVARRFGWWIWFDGKERVPSPFLLCKGVYVVRVLIVEAGKEPRVGEVSTLKEMQKVVGGRIQAVYQ